MKKTKSRIWKTKDNTKFKTKKTKQIPNKTQSRAPHIPQTITQKIKRQIKQRNTTNSATNTHNLEHKKQNKKNLQCTKNTTVGSEETED